MINFKQGDSYWNNFNNWDEAKLSDSTRPRDEFWFRIKPWMQSDKWDFRSANKNTYMTQYQVKWVTRVGWSTTWDLLYQYPTVFQESFTMDDLSDLVWYQNWNMTTVYNTFDANYIQNIFIPFLKWDSVWSPNIKITDNNIEIAKNWTYIVYMYANFLYPYPHDTSLCEKLFVSIKSKTSKSNRSDINRISARSCFTNDWVVAEYMWALEKWTILNCYLWHTFSSETVFCTVAANIIQLS